VTIGVYVCTVMYFLCVSEQKASILFVPFNAEHCMLTMLTFEFLSGAIAYIRSRYGAGTGPVHLDNIQCFGFEDSLINCSRSDFGDVSVNCADHSEDASVFCPSEYY